MLLYEHVSAYCRRRGRLAGAAQRIIGRWSVCVAGRILEWRDHLERPATASTWASQLLCWHAEVWLQQCLLAHGCQASSGRTGTRASAAGVCLRWHDGPRAAERATAVSGIPMLLDAVI